MIFVKDQSSMKLSKGVINPSLRKGELLKENESLKTRIEETKKLNDNSEKMQLPGITTKTTTQALEELRSQKTTVTNQIYLSDYIEMASGCTLVENGKPKTS